MAYGFMLFMPRIGFIATHGDSDPSAAPEDNYRNTHASHDYASCVTLVLRNKPQRGVVAGGQHDGSGERIRAWRAFHSIVTDMVLLSRSAVSPYWALLNLK